MVGRRNVSLSRALASAAVVFALANAIFAAHVQQQQQYQQQQQGIQQQYAFHPTSVAESSRYSQDDSNTASSSSSSMIPAVDLHRFCMPPSKAQHHWPSVLKALRELQKEHTEYELDFWSKPRTLKGSLSSIAEEEESCLDFTYSSDGAASNLLDSLVHHAPRGAELEWTILADHDELSSRIDSQMTTVASHQPKTAGTSPHEDGSESAFRSLELRNTDSVYHNGYHPLANVSAFLSQQAEAHSGMAELVNLGLTYENRTISGLRIGKRDLKTGRLPSKEIVITAGAHGREWITVSTALYLISSLLDHPALLSKVSIVVIPVLNPDGYAYTWTRERFFRKNRQYVSSRVDWLGRTRSCYGIDISRNFPTNFHGARIQDACGSVYPGTAPLEATEAQTLANYLTDEGNDIIAYFDLHSYGQLFLYPWLSCDVDSSLSNSKGNGNNHGLGSMPDEEDLYELALGATRAGRLAHNKSYRVGRGCPTMYTQTGTIVDFAYGPLSHIKWSYEIELRDEGSFGFTLPPEMIRPTGEETWEMLRYAIEFVEKREKL